jgi:hypothetical protein
MVLEKGFVMFYRLNGQSSCKKSKRRLGENCDILEGFSDTIDLYLTERIKKFYANAMKNSNE